MVSLLDAKYGHYQSGNGQMSSESDDPSSANNCIVKALVVTIAWPILGGSAVMLSSMGLSEDEKEIRIGIGGGLCAIGCLAAVAACALRRLCSDSPSKKGYEGI